MMSIPSTHALEYISSTIIDKQFASQLIAQNGEGFTHGSGKLPYKSQQSEEP